MVDSGCMRSACPRWFAGKLDEPSRRMRFTTASGQTLPHHGSTDVPFETATGQLGIRFEVTDVGQPMLSVAQAVDAGRSV
eukprot:1662736-Lingulodinium_polyedra.AAC.1